MKEQIEALIAELHEEAAGAPNDLICSGLARIADRLTAALAADAGGWRSMNTAPRDGTRVLISRRGKVHVGRFVDDGSARKPRPYWLAGDAVVWGLSWAKATPPDGWMPLPEGIPPPPQEPAR